MNKTASVLILMLILASFCYLHVKPAYSSIESWTSGLETGDTNEWDGSVGSPDVHGDYKLNGSYGMKCDSDEAGAGDCVNTTLPSEAVDRWNCTFWFQLKQDLLLNDGLCIFDVWHGSDRSIQVSLSCDGTGNDLYCYSGAEFATFDSLANNTWHKLEIFSVLSENTTFQLNGADAQTLNSTAYLWSMMRWGCRWRAYDSGLDIDVWFDDFEVIYTEGTYYFNFNFYDLDSADVELYVDWALWNSTHDLGYTEGSVSLDVGTYYLKVTKYDYVFNTTTLNTATYGNTTIDINLNMKRHQSCSNGFIVSNNTISSVSIDAETPQLLKFTIEGTTPSDIRTGVAKNASYITEYADATSNFLVDHTYDDAREFGNGVHSYSGDWNHAYSYSATTSTYYRCSGSRFDNVDIPNSASITSANFSLYVYSGAPDDANFNIYGNKVGNASDFNDDWHVISRARTTASIPWVDFNMGSGWKTSDDVKTVIQELVDQATWVSGNALVILLISNTDSYRQLRFYEYTMGSEYAHKLDVSYSTISNLTGWTYANSPSHIGFNKSTLSMFEFHFPASDQPDVGPNPSPSQHRVVVNVRLHGEWVHMCNVTVKGGPANTFEWGLTDVFGRSKFTLKTGPYEVVATYQQYRKGKSIHVSSHMTVGIDLTEADYYPDGFPEDEREEPLAWFALPQLDLTTEAILVFIIPLAVLIVYAVKKATEKPKRKWKYSYLR